MVYEIKSYFSSQLVLFERRHFLLFFLHIFPGFWLIFQPKINFLENPDTKLEAYLIPSCQYIFCCRKILFGGAIFSISKTGKFRFTWIFLQIGLMNQDVNHLIIYFISFLTSVSLLFKKRIRKFHYITIYWEVSKDSTAPLIAPFLPIFADVSTF